MALDEHAGIAKYDAPEKDLYEIGEMPPLGYVPKKMYAWAIRQDRHGEPDKSFQKEVVDTWEIDSHEVLVLVMAAGVNYNGVWAGLGVPISPFDVHKQPFHVAGSDASGIIWAVGDKVKRWKVGDEVVIHCNQDDGDDEECNGGDPMFSPTQRIWGYETHDGSFAQFTRVQAQQLMPRPKHLTWEESACYTLTLATAYRMLFGHEPHDLKPGQNVLVWGASGGLGSFAIQLINAAGAWADEIATLAGLAPLGLTPMRRSVARLAAPGGHDPSAWPMLFGPGERWYAKADAGALIVSLAEETPCAPMDAWPHDMDLAEALARYQDYVTEEVTRPISSWAGLRTFAPDRNLVLGAAPQEESFIWAVGQGGYGFFTAPAASQLVADTALGRRPQLSAEIVAQLSPARFAP